MRLLLICWFCWMVLIVGIAMAVVAYDAGGPVDEREMRL